LDQNQIDDSMQKHEQGEDLTLPVLNLSRHRGDEGVKALVKVLKNRITFTSMIWCQPF